jgi:RimJ/RimL family protein N-acetyltransferase
MLEWMRDPDVRFNVGVNREPSMEATEEWLGRATSDPSFHARAIIVDGQHTGNVILDRIDRVAGTARLSIYIGRSGERHRGIGRKAIGLILRDAFQSLGLKKVWLTVRTDNEPAIRCYKAAGFGVDERLVGGFQAGAEKKDALHMSIAAGAEH